jgi:pimeloyl-ACP methyl ester carboxylesterase
MEDMPFGIATLRNRTFDKRPYFKLPKYRSGIATRRMIEPRSLLQPDWRETRILINDVSLYLVEVGRPGDPLVILLHGFPEFWWAWRHQLTPLAEAGFHVVAPDMRGYDKSDAPPDIGSYALDILAADVVAIADSYSANQFHLVGHDWGAVIGWWVTARYPTRVGRTIVMDGPHPDIWEREVLRHPTQALRSTYVAFFQLPWVPEATLAGFDYAGLKAMMQRSASAGTFEKGALECYAEAWANAGSLTGMLNYYRALRARPTEGAPARLTVPTLILWAGNDSFLERHVAESGLALCDDGRLEIVDGASHWLHLEKPAWLTNKMI